jgi:hypothetical protein
MDVEALVADLQARQALAWAERRAVGEFRARRLDLVLTGPAPAPPPFSDAAAPGRRARRPRSTASQPSSALRAAASSPPPRARARRGPQRARLPWASPTGGCPRARPSSGRARLVTPSTSSSAASAARRRAPRPPGPPLMTTPRVAPRSRRGSRPAPPPPPPPCPCRAHGAPPAPLRWRTQTPCSSLRPRGARPRSDSSRSSCAALLRAGRAARRAMPPPLSPRPLPPCATSAAAPPQLMTLALLPKKRAPHAGCQRGTALGRRRWWRPAPCAAALSSLVTAAHTLHALTAPRG